MKVRRFFHKMSLSHNNKKKSQESVYVLYIPNLLVSLSQNWGGSCRSTFLPIFKLITLVGIIFLLNPSPLSTTRTIVCHLYYIVEVEISIVHVMWYNISL